MAATPQLWLNGIIVTIAGAAIIGSFATVRDYGRLEERLDNQVDMMIALKKQYTDDESAKEIWARSVDRDLASLKEYRQTERNKAYRQ